VRVTVAERHRLSTVTAPGGDKVRTALRRYLAISDMPVVQVAEQIHRGESTVNIFLQNRYQELAGNDELIRKTIWDYLERYPIDPAGEGIRLAQGRLFETENFRIIGRYLGAACERGEVCLLYGPPGTQKTFALSHLIAERFRQKKNDALYVYASHRMLPMALLKRIGRAAGVFVNLLGRDRVLNGILSEFSRRPSPPAVVVDEAQHLPIGALEILRELHDRSGCGLVLAGSHNLFENFLRGRQYLEQWLSRIDSKDPLPGLLECEVREIAARELGNGQPAKLGEKQLKAILSACRVDDVFARGEDGRVSPRKYLSVRRLVKFLGQVKDKSARAREGVA